MNTLFRFFVLVAGCLLVGCADQVVPEAQDEVVQDRVVGRVASVYADGGYLLIQRYGAVKLEGDKVFYVRGTGDVMASLKVTGERLGQFIAADIVNGEPKVGDAVYERILSGKKRDGMDLSEGVELPMEEDAGVKPAADADGD